LLVQDNRRPGSRYLWFFPIALFTHRRSLGNEARLGYPPPAALPPDESRFVADVAEDIATRRPPLIFVPTLGACQGCPAGFKVMDYLVAVGLVDKILQEHTRVADVSGNAVFVRTDRLGHGAGS